MADKVLSVALSADVGQYVAGIRSAAAETAKFDRALTKAGAAGTAGADAVAKSARKNSQAMTDLGRAGVVTGGLLLAGFGMAAKATLNFDKAISGLSAATHATGKDLAALRQAALDAGAATAFSATDAARAQTELAKAGVAVADILSGGLRGALDLAAAGQLDVGRAAEIAATAMTQFKLAGGDVARVADALAAGAGKAQGEVEDIAQALQQSGLVAAQFGLSLEDTVGSLGMFAKAGLLGSDAGTSFKTALSRMIPSSAEAQAAMDRLGISFFDAQGKFVGIERAAGLLKSSLSGLTQEQRQSTLQTIFGQDAIRAATVLFENGAEGVRGWRDNVSEAGFAAATAAKKLDNLAGDLEALGGSIETALIGSGSHANGVLRELVQTTTGLVNVYNDLSGPVQLAATALIGISGAVALVGGAALIAVPKIEAFKVSLATAGPKTQLLGKGILGVGRALAGPWGLALAAATVGLALFARKKQESAERVAEFTRAIEADSGALAQNTRAAVVNEAQKSGMLDTARKLGVALTDVTDAVLGDEAALGRVNAALDANEASARAAAKAAAEMSETPLEGLTERSRAVSDAAHNADELRGKIGGLRGELRSEQSAWSQRAAAMGEQSTASRDLAGVSGELANKFADQKKAASDAAEEIDELKQRFEELIGVHVTAAAASRAVEASIDDVAAAARKAARGTKDFHFELDKSTGRLKDDTKAQRAAGEAVEASIDKITVETDALLREGVAKKKVAKISGERIDKLRDELIATDLTTAQVDRLLGSYGLIKDDYVSRIRASGADKAVADARRVRLELEKLRDREITLRVRTLGPGRIKVGDRTFNVGAFADGGRITGPGTDTSDSIAIAASRDEFMIKARSARELGYDRLDYMNRTGRLPGFAGGGLVQGMAEGGRPTFVTLEGVMGRREKFSFATFQRDLARMLAIQRRWQRDLRAITRRAGADVAEALEQMGEQGVPLVRKFAGASAQQLRVLTRQVRELGLVAPSALGAYSKGLVTSARAQRQFTADLTRLTKRGHGGIAAALDELGEEGMAIARQSAGASGGTLAKLAKQVTAAQQAKSAAEAMPAVLRLVALLQAGRGRTGVKGLVDGSGMGVAEVLGIVTLHRRLIEAAGSRNLTQLNADLAAINAGRQPKGYRYGGFAPEGEFYRYAEPGTGGEWNTPRYGMPRQRVAAQVRQIERAYSLPAGGATATSVVFNGGPVHVTVSGGDPQMVQNAVRRAIDESNQRMLRSVRAGVGLRN